MRARAHWSPGGDGGARYGDGRRCAGGLRDGGGSSRCHVSACLDSFHARHCACQRAFPGQRRARANEDERRHALPHAACPTAAATLASSLLDVSIETKRAVSWRAEEIRSIEYAAIGGKKDTGFLLDRTAKRLDALEYPQKHGGERAHDAAARVEQAAGTSGTRPARVLLLRLWSGLLQLGKGGFVRKTGSGERSGQHAWLLRMHGAEVAVQSVNWRTGTCV
jgi:hypothetical protein